MKKNTLEDFILKSNEKHNYRYNYANVLYINNRTNVLVNCIEHGEFLIRPDNHLMGNGCYECSGNKHLVTILRVKDVQTVVVIRKVIL